MSAADDDTATDEAAPLVERSEQIPRGPSVSTRRSRTWWFVLVAVVALLVAYDLFEAVANLTGVVEQVNAYNEFADENGLAVAGIPWVVLVANLLVSPVAFVVALRLGRRRPLAHRALFLLAGLAAAAALSLSLAAFA